MTPEAIQTSRTPFMRAILTRFFQLLSAQGIEGIVHTLFFLYLAWTDTQLYGEVMYAVAVAGIATKLVQFGLYYPLVGHLSKVNQSSSPEIINRANVIIWGLLFVSVIGVWGMTSYRGFSPRMGWIVFLVSLGTCSEVLADTIFADLRVRGLQNVEVEIRIASAISAYGFGLATAGIGLHPIIVACYKLVSFAVRFVFALAVYLKAYSSRVLVLPRWEAVWELFRHAAVFALIQILGTFYNKTNVLFLEGVVGVKGVAFYSATYSLVDAISMLASEQLLGWVVFPLLSVLWWKERDAVLPVVRRTARWLMAIAFPIMFFLATESELIIGLIYPAEFKDAAWMQKYLVWTILFSFEANLFSYVMMVAGKPKQLLAFALVTTVLNLLFNVTLVNAYGLAGGCIVIIFTKMTMAILTVLYCQLSFGFFKKGDFFFPVLLATFSGLLFILIEPALTLHPAVGVTLAFYTLALWRFGEQFLGPLVDRK